MAKVKIKIDMEILSAYQLKRLVVLLCETVFKNLEIEESDVPNEIKRHFKKVIQ